MMELETGRLLIREFLPSDFNSSTITCNRSTIGAACRRSSLLRVKERRTF
jgi:hypothetical protein